MMSKGLKPMLKLFIFVHFIICAVNYFFEGIVSEILPFTWRLDEFGCLMIELPEFTTPNVS